jgi:hypothetical protein
LAGNFCHCALAVLHWRGSEHHGATLREKIFTFA